MKGQERDGGQGWLPTLIIYHVYITLICRHNGTICKYDMLIYCIVSINAI